MNKTIGHISAQKIGVFVRCFYDVLSKQEVAAIWLTGGENNPVVLHHVGTYSESSEFLKGLDLARKEINNER